MAVELMNYAMLCDYVSSRKGSFSQSDATRLWTTMTANLPTDDETRFTLFTRQRRPIKLEHYRNWIRNTSAHGRRNIKVKERRGLYVGRDLLLHFYRTAGKIDGYGPKSRELLAAWLGGCK